MQDCGDQAQPLSSHQVQHLWLTVALKELGNTATSVQHAGAMHCGVAPPAQCRAPSASRTHDGAKEWLQQLLVEPLCWNERCKNHKQHGKNCMIGSLNLDKLNCPVLFRMTNEGWLTALCGLFCTSKLWFTHSSRRLNLLL